jgi:hypothetical protein
VTLTTLALSMALSACDGGEGVRAATASRAADAPSPSPSSSRRLAPWDARAPVWPDEHCRRCTVAAAIRSRYAPAAGAAAPGVGPMRSPLPGGRAGVLRAQAQWET